MRENNSDGRRKPENNDGNREVRIRNNETIEISNDNKERKETEITWNRDKKREVRGEEREREKRREKN